MNEINNSLLMKLTTIEKKTYASMKELDIETDQEAEIHESEESMQKVETTETNVKQGHKKTSIEQQIILNSIKLYGEPKSSENEGIPKIRHVREGSLFNEIIALKKNDIIDEQVFEEGFNRLNHLNNELKAWGTFQKISEIEISIPTATTQENTLQKPLLKERNMLNPDENLRSMFKSRQMLPVPVLNPEERKERKKTESVKNPYEDFFILVY